MRETKGTRHDTRGTVRKCNRSCEDYNCHSLAPCISFQPFKIYKLQATLSQTAPLANSSTNVFVFACECVCVCMHVYSTLLPRPYGTMFRREDGQCFRGRVGTTYCVSIYIHTHLFVNSLFKMYVCMYICKYVHMHAYECVIRSTYLHSIHTYIYIHILRLHVRRY